MKKVFFTAIAALTLGLALFGCKGPTNNDNGPIFYTVSFDLDGGLPEQDARTVAAGAKATKPADDPEKTDSVFLGWYEGNATAPFDFDAAITKNVALKAKWFVEGQGAYLVTFDMQGGSPIAPQVVEAGNAATRPAPEPARQNHVFLGWYREANFSTAFDFSEEITQSITLYANYAKWAIALTENQWTDGEITATARELWYAFDVEPGKTYRIWVNGGYEGDGSKNLGAAVDAWLEDGGEIAFGQTYGFNNPITFTPASSGAVYVKVRGWNTSDTGTFGIVYSASATRPALPAPDFPADAIALTVNQWTDGEITATVTELWHAFDVEQGKTYRVWWNDMYDGDGSKSLWAAVSAWYEDGGEIAIGRAAGFPNPITFTPTSDGTVYVRVRGLDGLYARSTGTFGIVYSTGNTRPAIPVDFPANTIALTEDEWTDGEITTTATELWYSFDVEQGETYRVWWNDGDGDGTKTLYAFGDAWRADGGEIFIGIPGAFNNPQSFVAASSGAVYLRIRGQDNRLLGTFAVAYSSGSTRPAITP
ncbi:MAG: InlB B-repeat-containing protein [Treponema sp.]|nr:InlB B-repeat-containing protein [Treponema sp.]